MDHRPKRWNNKASTEKHLCDLQIGKGILKRTQRPNFKGKKLKLDKSIQRTALRIKGRLTK